MFSLDKFDARHENIDKMLCEVEESISQLEYDIHFLGLCASLLELDLNELHIEGETNGN